MRVEDALKRMTLDEKIRIIHAQSKFHRLVFHDWDSLIFGQTTDLTVCVLMCFGMSGNRQGRLTTLVWLSRLSHALLPPGIRNSLFYMAKASARKHFIEART